MEEKELLLKALDVVSLVVNDKVDEKIRNHKFTIHIIWAITVIVSVFLLCAFFAPTDIDIKNESISSSVSERK